MSTGGTTCRVERLDRAAGLWRVTSAAGRTHLVTLNPEIAACDCPDFAYRHRLCKHVTTVLKAELDEQHRRFQVLLDKLQAIALIGGDASEDPDPPGPAAA